MDHQAEISPFCSLLLAQGRISEKDAANALTYQKRLGGNIGAILIRLGAISEESLLESLSERCGVPIIDPLEIPTDSQTYLEAIEASGIPVDWWLDQEALPWLREADEVRYVAREPLASFLVESLEKAFPQKRLTPFFIRSYSLDKALESVSGLKRQGDGDLDMQRLREIAEEAPVIEFVANLLSQALDQRASDVHIEPGRSHMEIRFRIDGILYLRFTLAPARYPAIASRVKLISGIDIAERRLPQDGRVSVRISGTEVDLRVSSIPGVYGESIVLRLLPKEQHSYSIDDIGMLPDHKALLRSWMQVSNGIVLVTGPTGSGKSTTLYGALATINDGRRKIITVEDPVEYYVDGIIQIQTNAEIGYTFARALRSIMRQDPDVVMVGEIRDRDTAEIAIQAALTGHLVLSTLHTNSSLAAFVRLIDMGIDPFLVATPVRAVMAQRLVRRLCPHCAQPIEPPPSAEQEVAPFLPLDAIPPQADWKKAVGCPRCQQTGYIGRLGIYELVPVSPELQEAVLHRETEQALWRRTAREQIRNMRIDGLLKARCGLTSREEILRVISL